MDKPEAIPVPEHYLAYEARGRSPNQNVRTPQEFLEIVNAEFPIAFDLAAEDYEASVAEEFFAPPATEDTPLAPGAFGYDTLSPDTVWPYVDGWHWLNPPFADIRPWAERVALEAERGHRILMLIPASVDSVWYGDFIEGRCEVRFLRPRITFVGHKDNFKKPVMLCIFEPGRTPRASQWVWRTARARGPKEKNGRLIVP